MIQLRTAVSLPEVSKKLSYRQNFLMMGSCFAENIGNWLMQNCFPIEVNPFGILYNPASIANSIESILSNREFIEKDIFFADGLWSSFAHHGSFSSPEKEEVLNKINISNSFASKTLKSCSHLFVTFGTSWVFENRADGKIVGNCHKHPAKEFNRYRLEVDEMVAMWQKTIDKLFAVNPEIHIILTISPIRHLKDGAFENQVSKSALFLLVAKLLEIYGEERITYFPSYELVMDELRDYRFYATDMTHMSETGIAFLQEKFETVFIDKESSKIMVQVEKLNRSLSHKPFRPEEKNYRDFIDKMSVEAKKLTKEYPFVNINRIIQVFNRKRVE